MVTGIVPPLAISLFHWEDFAAAINGGALLPAWQALLAARTEIEARSHHLNDDQRLRLANADAIVRKSFVPLLHKLGLYDYYSTLREKQERMKWWYFLD
ncbi:hypothetical protein EHM92_07975 [bacterium]|nr:MAG: hypothetical protein EHM92_07975 [bacterium]